MTGAAGNLGRVLLPALAAAGHQARAFDQRPVDGAHEVVTGDVRNLDDVRRAMDGVDAVVHGAALHGVHVGRWSDAEFWAINATGTFNVYAAAHAEGVRRVVLGSTISVYGQDIRRSSGPWPVVTEDTPPRRKDIYAVTKIVAEEIARHGAEAHGASTVALRYGMFVPEEWERYGFRLLFGGVDDRDVAEATVLALGHRLEVGFAAFNIIAPTPFAVDEAESLGADPWAVIERHYPGTRALVDERRLDPDELLWGGVLWPVSRAVNELGWQPRHAFDAFLDAFRRDDRAYYPYAGLPWWGVADDG